MGDLQTRPPVKVFTDGACVGNPGPGGFAAVLLYGNHRREISGGYRLTTNNRMEIMGVIRSLEALKRPCRVEVFTDSQYVCAAIAEGWARSWRRRGWRRANKEPALNSDLWAVVLRLCETHEVRMSWIRGHAGNRENERCDALAVAAANGNKLAVDEGYEFANSRGQGRSGTFGLFES